MAGFTDANLGSIVKQLGGLASQYKIFPFVFVGATGYSSPNTLSRSGAVLTGYAIIKNIEASEQTIDKVCASVFESVYLPIISEESLSEAWAVGNFAKPKFIIEFTR